MVIQKNGKAITFHVEPGVPHMPEYLSLFKTLLQRDFNPLKKIIIETINDEPASKSPYADDLRAFGFERNTTRLELWRQYR